MARSPRTEVSVRLRRAGLADWEVTEARDILYGSPDPDEPGSLYDSGYHPHEMLRYFRAAFEAMLANPVERIRTRQGDVRFVRPPISPPTIAGFGARCGISGPTLLRWREKHEEFSEAWDLCMDLQQAVLLELGLHGAYDSRFLGLAAKNLMHWQERVEQTQRGGVVIHVDAEDLRAVEMNPPPRRLGPGEGEPPLLEAEVSA